MTNRARKGFTLVELLVVITIIGMLVGLLVPAVIMAREAARRAKCSNNQHELAMALQSYEQAKKQLPGYVNKFGAVSDLNLKDYQANQLTWVEMVFDHMGQGALWTVVRKPLTGAAVPNPAPPPPSITDQEKRLAHDFGIRDGKPGISIPQLHCPSDTLPEGLALSYAANCGLSDDTGDYPKDCDIPARYGGGTFTLDFDRQRNAAYGLFFDQTPRVQTPTGQRRWPPVRVTTDRIPDGAAQTILFGENIQAYQWLPHVTSTAMPRWPFQLDVGLLWWPDDRNDTYTSNPISHRLGVNEVINDPSAPLQLRMESAGDSSFAPGYIDPASGSQSAYTPQQRIYARPSSNHPGGAMVTFADGHQELIADSLGLDPQGYLLYQRWMTPDTSTAIRQGLIPEAP